MQPAYPVRVIRSNRKTIGATVSDGALQLRVPMRADDTAIAKFLTDYDKQIRRLLQSDAEARARTVRYRGETGEYLPWQGGFLYLLRADCARTERLADTLCVPLSCADPLGAIRRWMQRNALAPLSARLRELSAATGLTYTGELRLFCAKNRFGTCDADKRIRLNYKLACLPADIADYVIVHELAHTIRLDHSPRFWEIVARFCPDYKSLRKRLLQAQAYLSEL